MSTTVRPIEDRRLLGIAMVLGGYFCFTIIDSCAKWLTLSGLPTGEVVFIRYAGQFVLVTAIFAPLLRVELVRTRRPGSNCCAGCACWGRRPPTSWR